MYSIKLVIRNAVYGLLGGLFCVPAILLPGLRKLFNAWNAIKSEGEKIVYFYNKRLIELARVRVAHNRIITIVNYFVIY